METVNAARAGPGGGKAAAAATAMSQRLQVAQQFGERTRGRIHMRGQAVAIALVVMCGVATHVMFLSTLNALRETQQGYYREYRFADVFVSLKRAPEALRERIAALPGVARADTRVVAPLRVDMPDFGEPVNALMVSLPAPGGLNALHLREGRLPAPERADEVVVSTPFAEAHGLHPGGRFHVILNGRRQALTVAGTALSPEFIQQMRPGSAFPDSKRYGVMWMERRALGQAYDLEGAFNDLAISLAPGASAAAVMAAADGLLERYGGLGAYARHDQRSHRFLSEELQQLGTLARLFQVELGTGFVQWRRQVQLATAAAELIQGTGVNQIARSLGYSPSSFSDMFRRELGMSPSLYATRQGGGIKV